MTTETKLRFGLMTGTDEKTLVKTFELVNKEFPDGTINTFEVGVRRGETSRAIHQFFTNKNRINFHVGIDNENDVKDGCPFEGCHFVVGNSIAVYNELRPNSQHFGFLDACHNYPMTLADFLVYSDKIIVGGYIALHDTSPAIKPFTDYQGMGSKWDLDMFISCRKALIKLKVYENKFPDFQLVFDEYDLHALTGGVTVLKRIA